MLDNIFLFAWPNISIFVTWNISIICYNTFMKQYEMNFDINQLQGVSEWTDIGKSALRGRGINDFIEVWFLVASGGVEIWVSSNSFQKNDIGWPQQPPTEKVLKFNMIFHDSTQKKDFFKT